jgi:RNA polymerase-binding transcription factor DksA
MATAKSAFTAKELADLKKRLLEEKSELEEQLSTIEEASFAASQSDITGEVGGFDDENADAGTFTFERERDLSIENNVRDLLRKVDDALERMSNKTFGICAVCGKPIEKARVKALPYVELCIKDAQAQARAR